LRTIQRTSSMIAGVSIRRTLVLFVAAILLAPCALAASVRSGSHKQKEDLPELSMSAPISSFKVKIELYYMPQCPGCRQLISTSISEAFQTAGFSDMADVEFKPWGFHHREDGHPVGRIFDNVLESCALQTIGNQHQDLQFMYIECIDRTGTFETNPSNVDRSCAKVIGLTNAQTKQIEECAISPEGKAIAEKYLREGENMEMAYAPWIVVNGHHSKEQEDQVWNSLFHYVCEMYSGPYRSKECHNYDEDLIAEQL